MRSFQWSNAHAIYLPEIDAEHRTLFRVAHDLQNALQSRAPKAHVQELLRSLLTHAEEHFAHEERLMREAGYSSYAWHKGQHDGIRKRIKKAVKAFEQGESSALPETLDHLGTWFRDHTAVTDRMMGAHLRNCQRLRALAIA